VLSIGRLTYYKGYLTLIRAASLSERIAVRIVGEGGMRRRLESEIAHRGLSGRVSLEGELPDDELRALLSGCDCLCLSSIERTEAFGLVLLEAMRYGKPIVAADIPGSGVGWVIREAGCGILALPNDPKALQEALSLLDASPSLREDLAIRGSAAFGRTFHIRQVAAQIGEMYLRTMKGRRDHSTRQTPP
jgi:rhamnosyl/mannosyltransferase